MAHVITDLCTKDGACVPVCPVSAIFPQDELPADKAHFAQVDADWSAKRR